MLDPLVRCLKVCIITHFKKCSFINIYILISPNVHKGRWSKSEDQALTEAVKYYQKGASNTSLPWNRIAENIPHRTGIQCQARWTEALDPAVRKGRWHPDEDKLLSAAIAKFGCCWIRVASMIPTRTQRQCRTRWNQIHSQQLKANSASNKKFSGLNRSTLTNSRATPPMKFEFIPSTLTMHTKEYQQNQLTMDENSCIVVSTSPTIDDIIAQYASNNNAISSASSTSSQSTSYSSLSCSPTSIIFPSTPPPTEQTSSDILQHEKESERHEQQQQQQQLTDLFPMMVGSKTNNNSRQNNTPNNDSASMSSFLLNTDLDFLLNCLGS
jgi:hypothetical protein